MSTNGCCRTSVWSNSPPARSSGTRNGGPVRALFPLAGVLSLVQELPDGDSGQVAVVGREGLLGLPLFMGGDEMPTRAVVQCAGYGLALGREHLLQEFDRGGSFMRHLLRYTQALITQISLLVLCNRHHSIEQQLCRVILMSLDRVQGRRGAADAGIRGPAAGRAARGCHRSVGAPARSGRRRLPARACSSCRTATRWRRGPVAAITRPGASTRGCSR